MKRAFQLFALVAATSLASAGSVGCVEEETAGAREAAYPVGFTPPAAEAAAQPAPPPPSPAVANAAGQPGAPDRDVVVGEDEAAPEGPATESQAASGSEEYADTDPAALTDFRTALDPYGSWQDDPTYGTVWVPSQSVVGSDFTPYVSAGHWVYGDDYAWASDYSWGWAPFHYGRWVYGGGGWEWIPGRVYAGAWVSWRYGLDDWAYVGWAPLSPLWCWRGGIAVGIGYVPYAPYAFVPSAHLFAPALGGHLITGAAAGQVASHTQPWATAGGARVVAHPTVSGPPPASLHIQSASVAHATPSTAGLAQARAFSRPSSAVALGARPPQGGLATAGRAAMVAPSRAPYSTASRPPYSLGHQSTNYGYGSSSHFGGKLGGGFAGSAASAPPARPYYASSAPRSAPSMPGYRSSAPAYHAASPSYHSFGASAPAYHGSAGGGGGGGFHSGGGGGGFSGGGSHGGGGGFHSGGGGGHGGGHR